MAQAALRPSKSLGKLLRFKRKQAGLTLKQVGERLGTVGEAIPTSTLSHIEQGNLDPGSRRLHLLLRLFKIPSELASDLVDLETRGIELPEPGDFDAMLERAAAAWSDGDPNEGLAWFIALQHLCIDGDPQSERMQTAVLTFAQGVLRQGHLELARRILDQVLAVGPHPDTRARVYVFASQVWRDTGNLEVAAAFLQRAEEATSPDDREAYGWTLHQRALLEIETGRPDAAEASLEHALEHYKSAGLRRSETNARILKIRILRDTGRMDQAVRHARATVRFARKHGFDRAALSAQIQLGRTLIAAGRAKDALDPIHDSLAGAARNGYEPVAFDAHRNLWRAYEALGDTDRAHLELEKAGLHAQFVDSHDRGYVEVRDALARLEEERARPPASRKKA